MACTSQRPYDEIGVCLTDASELDDLKGQVVHLASRHETRVNDYSASAKRDLKALNSSIATENLFALLIEDERWFSKAGVVMINNFGGATDRFVGVSMFKNDALLGSDRNTDALRRDIIETVSARWRIIDAPSADGSYSECEEGAGSLRAG